MAILKLKPSCKDYLWGGTRLMTEFGKEYDGDKLAETWELSCHPDGPSYVANGEYAGETLSEYILMEGKKVTGTHSRHYSQFPLLIKFIDAKDDLSIQVHPDDEYAMKNEGQYGKTEMWYIVDCEEGASLYYGFSREVSKEEFEERIKNKTLLEVLNKVEVHKGDVLFIEPGTIHAIGKGNLIAEIQENSNVTYRVYDYGRKDANGKERDLHIEKALQVTKRVPILRKKSFEPHIVDCDYFTVDKVVLDGQRMKKIFGEIDKTSFASLLVLDGTGKVQSGEECVEVQKGDSVFITANAGEYEMEGKFEALLTTVYKTAGEGKALGVSKPAFPSLHPSLSGHGYGVGEWTGRRALAPCSLGCGCALKNRPVLWGAVGYCLSAGLIFIFLSCGCT